MHNCKSFCMKLQKDNLLKFNYPLVVGECRHDFVDYVSYSHDKNLLVLTHFINDAKNAEKNILKYT
jgi:hypothetical protein